MNVYISVSLRQRVREHFKDCCAYCLTAEYLTVSIFECEHIIPKVAGGETGFENLCLACPTCNRYKATRQEIVDSQTGELTPIFHPQMQNWEDHFTWSADSSQIIPLTAIGRVTVDALKMNRLQLIRVRHMWVVMNEHPPK